MDMPADASNRLDEHRQRVPKLSEATVDYGMLPSCIGFSVKLVWILGYGLLTRAFGDSGITPQRFSMLELIGCNPGLQQVHLGNALGLSRSAATLSIDFWAERGCVERRADPGDRRSFSVFLTGAGQVELARLRKLVRASDDALIDGLTPDEIEQLRGLLAKIHL